MNCLLMCACFVRSNEKVTVRVFLSKQTISIASKSSMKSIGSRRMGSESFKCLLKLTQEFRPGFLNELGMPLCRVPGHAFKDVLFPLRQKKKMKLEPPRRWASGHTCEGVHCFNWCGKACPLWVTPFPDQCCTMPAERGDS